MSLLYSKLALAYYEQHYNEMQMYIKGSTHYLGNKQDFDVSSETLHYPWIPSWIHLKHCKLKYKGGIHNWMLNITKHNDCQLF